MVDETNILISLGDPRTKEIAEVIGNKSCNLILDFLASRNATVTEISVELKMPINTVDYNVKKLLKVGLIEKADSWWSVKGKKMPSYKVSNKKITISPRNLAMKSFLWVAGAVGVATFLVGKFVKTSTDNLAIGGEMMLKAVPEGATFVGDSSRKIVDGNINNNLVGFGEPGIWFLAGAIFALAVFSLVKLINERRFRK